MDLITAHHPTARAVLVVADLETDGLLDLDGRTTLLAALIGADGHHPTHDRLDAYARVLSAWRDLDLLTAGLLDARTVSARARSADDEPPAVRRLLAELDRQLRRAVGADVRGAAAAPTAPLTVPQPPVRPGIPAPAPQAGPAGPSPVCECLCTLFAHQDCTGSGDLRVLIARSGVWRSLAVCSPCLADLTVRVPASALRWPA